MADQVSAARVFFSLAEISDLLKLAPGYALEWVGSSLPDHPHGIWMRIRGPGLPPNNTDEPLPTLDLSDFVRHVNEHLADQDREHGYTPAKPIVAEADPAKWPQFPGEGLDYRGRIAAEDAKQREAQRRAQIEERRVRDAGEDIHTGGPR